MPDNAFTRIMSFLREHGLECDVSLGEILAYMRAPSYEEDTVTPEQVLGEELLLLHEAAEVCILERLGYEISGNIIREAYPDTYKAHLQAMGIELAEAARRGRWEWVAWRCGHLKSYLNDPYLPRDLEPIVRSLVRSYCGEGDPRGSPQAIGRV